VTTTTCKTSSGSSSSGRGADDDKEEKVLDTDQRRKRASISEDEEEEEEEEGGNPLPGTPQQPEQVLDQDNKAFQQLGQQQHDKELQNLLSAEIAGEKASYKDTGAKPKAKPTTRGGRGGGNSSNRGGGARGDLPPLPPMAQRDKCIYCSCCLQWGKHAMRECVYTKDGARKELTPMDKSVRTGTTPRDNQFYVRGAGEEKVFLAREDAQRRGVGLG
jgi:hypothetical protein